MNWSEVESFLDKLSTLKPLPVNSRRTDKSYTSAYESAKGRHLVLERRNSGFAKVYFEMPFDASKLGLTPDSVVKYYGANEARAGLERASRRFAVGNPMACVKVATLSDLQRLLASENEA